MVMQQETVVRLINDADTLLPRLMRLSQRTVTTMPVGNRPQAHSRTEEKRFVSACRLVFLTSRLAAPEQWGTLASPR
jgi:hypothetical protein